MAYTPLFQQLNQNSQRQRSVYAMEIPAIPISCMQIDHAENLVARTGVLMKKDVFRWSLDVKLFLKPTAIRSDYFEFGPTPGSKYCLVANISDSMTGYFTVGLCRLAVVGSSKNIPIKVSFAILDTRDRCHYPCEKQMTTSIESVQTSFDRNTLTAHNSMFLINNQLRIQCSLDASEIIDEQRGKLLSKPEIHSCNESTHNLASDLRTILESGQHSDVTLRLEGREFKAHRSILVARSSVFAAMFEHDTLEKQQNTIDIVDVPSDTMAHLLHYLYTGQNKELSTVENLSLFVAADKYDLPKLKKQCSSSISTKITSDTALNVLTLSYLHQDEQLKQAAIDAILGNALNVMKSEAWLTFLVEYPELANSVILKLALKSQLA